MFKINGLDHVAITCRDVIGSTEWYQQVLGMEHRYKGMWGGSPVMLFCGRGGIAIFPASTDAVKLEGGQSLIAVQHIAFNVSRESFQAAQAHLREKGVAFEFQDHDIAKSIYFKDPDGHELEITTYEVNQG
jgi:catechol 2,3-dioxygenase-like lactoylglutathione lyase family enzyme